jgi:hypothetical protein
MSKKNTTDRNATEIQLRTLAAGLANELPPGTPLTVDGEATTSDALAARASGYLSKYTSAREAHATSQKLVHERDEIHPDVRHLIVHLRKTLDVKYGGENPILLKFGFEPHKKKAALTHDQKVAKADKARATREKNHPKSAKTGEQPSK